MNLFCHLLKPHDRIIKIMARDTGMNRENLYRALSAQGNPELISLEKLLKGLGLRLSVEVDNDLHDAA